MKDHLKAVCQGKSNYITDEFDVLTKELKEVGKKKENLLDMMLSQSMQSITRDVYDKKMQELLERQHEITNYLESQNKADETFYITVKSMLDLCSKAYEVFESSNIDKKRQLLGFLLSNLQIKDVSVCFALKNHSMHW
jgi:hypothetical protein